MRYEVHNINEDYQHYMDRKRRDVRYSTIAIISVLIVLSGGAHYFFDDTKRQTRT